MITTGRNKDTDKGRELYTEEGGKKQELQKMLSLGMTKMVISRFLGPNNGRFALGSNLWRSTL